MTRRHKTTPRENNERSSASSGAKARQRRKSVQTARSEHAGRSFLRHANLCIVAALCITTIAVYAPVSSYRFIWNYDDSLYVEGNAQVRQGLTLEGLRWALTAEVAANWHPVTLISHMLDVSLFGLNAGAHHLMNVFFHTANTALLFFLLYRLTAARWHSAFVAALFALHPLHVQSVAWIAERKDVLSTLFWLLTTWAYVQYAQSGRRSSYGLMLCLFVLGLAAKPMLVTLPFTLLLLDYWPLGRLGESLWNKETATRGMRLIVEKLPLFLLALVSSLVTFYVQRSGGSRTMGEHLPFFYAAGNAIISYVKYLYLMFWPIELAVFYPHPLDKLRLLDVVAALFCLLTVTAGVLRFGTRRPYLIMGWFWYLGTLVPVIGLIQVGSQALADRYTYVPLTGIFIILVWGLGDSLKRVPGHKVILGIAGSTLLIVLSAMTRFQLQFWENDETLFRRALAVTEDNYVAHSNLGGVLIEQGQADEAREHFARVIELSPLNFLGYYGMGDVYLLEGNTEKAIELYSRVLDLKPDHPLARYKRGAALIDLGRLDEAVEDLQTGIDMHPENPMLHEELSRALDRMGRTREAAVHHSLALKYGGPEVAEGLSKGRRGQINRARALVTEGQLEQAAEIYLRVLRDDPRSVEAHNNLANIRARQGRYEEAVRQFQEAIKLQPGNASIHFNLAHAYLRQGKKGEALEHFERAVDLDPDLEQAREEVSKLKSGPSRE